MKKLENLLYPHILNKVKKLKLWMYKRSNHPQWHFNHKIPSKPRFEIRLRRLLKPHIDLVTIIRNFVSNEEFHNDVNQENELGKYESLNSIVVELFLGKALCCIIRVNNAFDQDGNETKCFPGYVK